MDHAEPVDAGAALDASRIGGLHAVENPDQRGLSGTGRPEKPDELAPMEGKIDSTERSSGSVGLADTDQGKHELALVVTLHDGRCGHLFQIVVKYVL